MLLSEGIIGFMAHELGVEVKEVAAQGCFPPLYSVFCIKKVKFHCFRCGPCLYSLPRGRVSDADISPVECPVLSNASLPRLRDPVLNYGDRHHDSD